MSNPQILTIAEVREYVSDFAPNNYLLAGEEFTDTYMSLCMTLAVDLYNTMSPKTSYDIGNFLSKNLLLQGTLWKMYEGKAALLARNTMTYSDGGLQIPIEERSQLYLGLAMNYKANFEAQAQALKVNQNMNCGWGTVSSDQATFPWW